MTVSKGTTRIDVCGIALVLDALPAPGIFIDYQERIAVCNLPAQALFGDGAVGRHYLSILRQPAMIDAIEGVLQGSGPKRARYNRADAGRDTFWDVSVSPLAAMARRGALITFEDNTALREAVQMRRDFVANVSHELRTPLTALIGFIETLRGAAKNDATARDRFLEIMAREATRMNRLVQDLLSLSRVESEERLRPTDALNLNDLLRSVSLSLSPMIEKNNVTLAIQAAADMPPVAGDPDQLRQVFGNLIENAVKYGGAGKTVQINMRVIEREPSMRCKALQIDVVDQGMGIDPLHIPRLTERFYRVDSHRSREMGGTGLGLAIVKHIINRHRGRLRISSQPGHGSTFSVVLPTS